ncbi:MAG: ImmA/IrrE family metallo-endopeptidase [Nitrosomonas sp.]|jgi:Zn-dependent peptidase ImmA (M78 family)|nr:ImmA/IrrE family metallo-endopeptidase [Nitrosomonas sp.]
MPETLSLSINTLEWAAEKAGLAIYSIAHIISKRDPESILSGNLTLAQVRKFSEITKQPIGFLFLEEPPQEFKFDLPDLRTRKQYNRLSNNLIDTYKDVKYKQDWYREYLTDIGAGELEFVGKYSVDDKTETIANSIRDTLKLDATNLKTNDLEQYHDYLSRMAENAGILVFRNGIVKNNTHRSLDPNEFLGFAISDKLAPAIFINAADKTAEKIFTFAHELAHIWIGVSGVIDIAVNPDDKTELKCNSVASELLIPRKEFISTWETLDGTSTDRIIAIRKKFRVSEIVVARLAMENKKITSQEFWDMYNRMKKFFESQKSTGADGRAMPPIRNSRIFMKTVTHLLGGGDISFKEAGMLLNISPMKVGKYVS